MRFHGSLLRDEVNLVLNDDDVLDASDFKRHEMFPGLGLRARFVGGHHQHGTVHDGGAGDHDGHQCLVAWGIYEGHHTFQLTFNVIAAIRSLARGVVLAAVVFVERRVSITEFDGDASLTFFGVGVGPHAGQRLGQRGFSVVNVTDQTDVDLGLSGKLACHASPLLCPAIALSGSLRCFLALSSKDGGEGLLACLDHFEVDLTGVLGHRVSTEVSSLSKTIGLVSEAPLFAALLFVDDDFTFVPRGLGDEDGLAVAAFEVSAHGGAGLVGTTRDFEFVAGERLVAFADKQAVNDVADALSEHLGVVVASDFQSVGLAAVLGVSVVDDCDEFCHGSTSRDLSDKRPVFSPIVCLIAAKVSEVASARAVRDGWRCRPEGSAACSGALFALVHPARWPHGWR